MRNRKVFLGILTTAALLTVIFISMKAYYVAVALIAGTLIMGHREFWSLVRTRKMPPIDERVRENSGKSIRNGFIFFAIATAFLMLVFSINRTWSPDNLHLLGGLFVSAGVVYALSYLFYDRAEPKLGERGATMIKTFLLVAGIALAVFIISAFLHNIISGPLGVEEPVFFIISTIIAPLAFAVGLIGSLVIFIKALFSSGS